MYDLFNLPPNNSDSKFSDSTTGINKTIIPISGLIYIPQFITEEQEKNLINHVNSETWLSDIKRRVQHYGYKYDYKARGINYEMFLGQFPSWIAQLALRLYHEDYIDAVPDQMIINEYLPGQGIANHVDCAPCFGDTVISLSLNSFCIMDFINLQTKEKIEVLLEPRSLVVIKGEARYSWSHGIASRKIDTFHDSVFKRRTRLSLTFRKVILK
ncbi:alpha-ketoglutarate-dependent dioxygenase AlkB [Mucilaginibacter sp.]